MAPPTISYPKEDDGPRILGATITMTTLALITMVTRLYVRTKVIKNYGWDDITMSAAMALSLTGQAIIIPEVLLGAGRHIDQIPPDDFQEAFKLNFVTQPIYLFAISLAKEAIGFFLLRIATQPAYRRAIITIMVFMAVYTVACFLTLMLQCTNLAVQWDPEATGTCWGKSTLQALSFTNTGLNILTDLLFAIIIPIPMLWHLQINRRQKASIIGILSLGIFVTVASCLRASFLVDYGKTGDWLWDSRNLTIWSVAENNVGIIAGNLPCLKPIFRSILGSTYGRGSRQKRTSQYMSNRYGGGTNGNTGKKTYSSLHSSNRAGDDPFRPYGGDAHMLTTIHCDNKNGNEQKRSGSETSMRNDMPLQTRSSTESVMRLSDQLGTSHGGITKTMEVNISDSRSISDVESSSMKHERNAAHMV